MKKKYPALAAFFIQAAFLFAAPSFSGVFDSTLSGGGGGAEKPAFTLEEYLNLRLQAKIGESAVFYSAFNVIARAGAGAAAQSGGFIQGDNFSSSIELERLYLHFSTERMGLDLGLFRQGFGYGAVWTPMDFLNPRNPLIPDARPRAILGAAFSVFPGETGKILGFAAAPKNPANADWGGALTGICAEKHGERLSVQALYSWETPDAAAQRPDGRHRAGLSLKADVEAGLFVDALYLLNPRDMHGVQGLSASCGADYSFAPRTPRAFFQSLVVAASYLYSGGSSETAAESGGVYRGRHYLYPSALYNLTNYTSLSAAALIALDDGSFAPVLGFQQSLAQGLDLSVSAQIYPLEGGEFGRESMAGNAAALSVKLRARF